MIKVGEVTMFLNSSAYHIISLQAINIHDNNLQFMFLSGKHDSRR